MTHEELCEATARKNHIHSVEEIKSHAYKDIRGVEKKCGKQCRKPGEPFDTHKRTLTTAHLDHNPQNCNKDNLKAYCAPCHLRYDAQHHAETRKKKKEGN